MTLDKNQKELLESIDRVYATVAADKKADRI